MKGNELTKKLKANGCLVISYGKEYDTWFSPITDGRFRIPKFETQEIPTDTLKRIMKQAGI